MCSYFIRHRNLVSSSAFLADACNLFNNTSPAECLSPQCALSFVVQASALETLLKTCNNDMEEFNRLVYKNKAKEEEEFVDESVLSSNNVPELIEMARSIAHHPLLAEIAANERFIFTEDITIEEPEVWNVSIIARAVIDGKDISLSPELLQYAMNKPWKAPCAALCISAVASCLLYTSPSPRD